MGGEQILQARRSPGVEDPSTIDGKASVDHVRDALGMFSGQ
jgi:hypothetical protein